MFGLPCWVDVATGIEVLLMFLDTRKIDPLFYASEK